MPPSDPSPDLPRISFEMAFDSLPDPVFIYNHSRRRIEKANRSAVERYGYSAEVFCGMGPWDIEAPYAREAMLPLIDGLRSRRSVVYCTEHRDAAGRRFAVEVHTVFEVIDGQEYFVAICRGLEERIESQRRVELAESRYQQIFENSLALVCVLNAEATSLLDANPALRALIGLPSLEGGDAFRRESAPAVKEIASAYAAFRAGSASAPTQGRLTGRNGEARWIEWRFQPLLDGSIFGLGQDVTDTASAMQALERSQWQLQRHLELSPVAMLIVRSDGVVERANQAFCRLFGYSRDEIPNLESWWRRAYPDPERRSAIRRDWDGRVRAAQREGRSSVAPMEASITRKDGAERSVEIGLGFAGETDLFVFADLTSRKRYEAQIRQQAQRLDLHFANTPLGVIEWDLSFKVARWNPAAEQIFGYAAEEALGMSGLLILPEGARDGVLEVWRQLALKKGGAVNVNDNLRKDGALVTCAWYNTPLVDDRGEVMGVASLVMDVTENRRQERELILAKEAAERASQAKSEFLSMMSHELRTPLNSIIGPCQLLRAQLGPEAGGGLLDIVLSSSEHLLDLINGILDLAKIESGEATPHRERLALVPYLGTRLAALREIALRKGLAFEVRCSLPADASIETDPVMLLQVLFNLIGNATKFTERGSIEVRAALNAIGSELILEVADTGVGIPEAELPTIFEPFHQVEQHGAPTQLGTGLGLAITRQLVALLGGSIAVESEVGVGSRFTVTLPVAPGPVDEAPETAPGQGEAVAEQSETQRPTILLVEDEPNNRIVCGALLRHLGFSCVTADTGEEAVDRYRRESYALVLLDIKLPGIDGVETLRRIREAAAGRPVYVIAQTAYALREQRERYLQEGFDAYLSKPLSIDELDAALRQGLAALGFDPEG